jgi:hypothetical protein
LRTKQRSNTTLSIQAATIKKKTLSRWITLAGLTAMGSVPAFGQAQQVPIPEQPSVSPQIEITGTGVGTLDLGRSRNALPDGGKASGSQINISDSALVIGAAQRLYKGGIGSFAVGGLALDQTNVGRGTQLFLHQAYVDYQSQALEAYLGRTDNPTAQVVTFPTLRGDDLFTFTNLLDPFSSGENVAEHRYSNVGAVTLNQNLHTFENFHVQHLIDSENTSTPSSTGLNSYGASIQYLGLPGLEAVEKVISYGAGYEHRSVARADGGSSEAVYAGGVINLKPSLVNLVDLRVLDNYTFGNSLNTFRNTTDTFRANSNAVTAAVRYLHSPFGKPAYQVSLTAGYKSYDKVSRAGSVGFALTGVKRLGDGFDAVAQYVYQHRGDTLANAYGGAREENSFQVGFIFNFDTLFNRSVGPRRSLLNLQHQYIPD